MKKSGNRIIFIGELSLPVRIYFFSNLTILQNREKLKALREPWVLKVWEPLL